MWKEYCKEVLDPLTSSCKLYITHSNSTTWRSDTAVILTTFCDFFLKRLFLKCKRVRLQCLYVYSAQSDEMTRRVTWSSRVQKYARWISTTDYNDLGQKIPWCCSTLVSQGTFCLMRPHLAAVPFVNVICDIFSLFFRMFDCTTDNLKKVMKQLLNSTFCKFMLYC